MRFYCDQCNEETDYFTYKVKFWVRFGDYSELVSAEIRDDDWCEFINMNTLVKGETADGEPITVNLRNASTLQILESDYENSIL